MSLRVLFVDDDRAVLDSLGRSLRQARVTWNVSFAESGAAALAVLAAEPVDAVIADSQMPGMDGASLLEEVHDNWPGVVRIMLSGAIKPGSNLRVAGVAHQFFEKPCPADRLCQAIERVRSFRSLVEDPGALVALTGIRSLPSPPGIVLRLNQAIASERSTLDDIALIVADDIAVSAKLLQLVNSAFFGLRQATTSIGRAVGMLGTNTVRALASVTSIIRSTDFDPAFVEHFDAHSQRVGAAAARFCPPDLRDHTPSAGLLHDIGWLVLADRARERFAELCARARVEGLDADLERTVFGATHSDVGAALLALWGLPIELVECTAWHHDGDAPSVLARAVLSGHDGDSGLGGWLGLVTTTDVS